jgi:hypothetical protein
MNRFKSASIPAMQVVMLLIVQLGYGSESVRGIWEHAQKMNTPELWNSERDLAQIEAIDLYVEYAYSPEILSDFRHFSRKSRIAWTFPIHSKIDPWFPQILICTTIELSHFHFRFFRNYKSHYEHGFRYLFLCKIPYTFRPGSEKAMKRRAILQIIFWTLHSGSRYAHIFVSS